MMRRGRIFWACVLLMVAAAIGADASGPNQCVNMCTYGCDESYKACQRGCWLNGEEFGHPVSVNAVEERS